MEAVRIVVYYEKNIQLSSSSRSFKASMKLIWESDPFKNFIPVKLFYENKGVMLYMDKNKFMAYLADEISESELIANTQCDNIYRNQIAFIHKGIEYEAQQLWKYKTNLLYLIDDDNPTIIEYLPHYFKEVS